ncbi:hypothetical protein M9Y10_016655 [Tritrichomonas musculus]|uniref:VASt domain-containing protein n=1 Tax=Tritrichomonas musculus TaxID=1915356 RepID=A0ABR2HWY3_9EUKA
MKNVILRYPSDKSFKEHKLKLAGTNFCSDLRTRIANELPHFKDGKYLLISKKYDNFMSFLKEDKPFNKLFSENRINIELVIPPSEAEILLPNQSTIHISIDLTKPVFENVRDIISYVQKTDNSYSIVKNNDDFILESFTFFFTPSRSDIDEFSIDNSNNNILNNPRIVSSTLPLLFQGWSGEKLTLIRRIASTDLIIAEERWKRREKQIEKMKKNFEEKDESNKNKKKSVKFDKTQQQNEDHISLKEKSKSINIFDLNNAKEETQPAEEAQDQSQETSNQDTNPSEEIFFDFTTEEFFYNCQLAVFNKICIFDINMWAALACLQCLAGHTSLKHTQIQNLIPFIPDSVQSAANQNQSTSNLTDILTEMKRKYNKYERMQAMRAYIQLCVEKGQSFCYLEEVKFLLLTKKWRVSSRRIIYISPNNISIAKDATSLNFLYQSKISDIINVSFDGDFITITFELNGQNDPQAGEQNKESLSTRVEKWRIKSRHPQILIYMINEFKTIFTQSSHILHNIPGSTSLKSVNSTDFGKLVSIHKRAKSSGLIGGLLLRPSLTRKSSRNRGITEYSNNQNLDNNISENNDEEVALQNDFTDSDLNAIYYDHFESNIDYDSDFVEPGISKLICISKEDANKSCLDLLAREQSRELKLVKKLQLPYNIDNINTNLLNTYSGADNMEEVPDLNWLLNFDKYFSLSQKNGKFIIIFGIVVIILFILNLIK